jgi:hypothetical protein
LPESTKCPYSDPRGKNQQRDKEGFKNEIIIYSLPQCNKVHKEKQYKMRSGSRRTGKCIENFVLTT